MPGEPPFISSSMSTRCPKCGADVEEGWPVCRKCFEPVKREGFFSRLLRAFGVKVNVSITKPASTAPGPTSIGINIKTAERIKIRDGKTGEMREYHSIDEVPEEYREKIRQAEAAALSGLSTSTKITITDTSGSVHHYNSLDEIPPELRALYEKARGS